MVLLEVVVCTYGVVDEVVVGATGVVEAVVELEEVVGTYAVVLLLEVVVCTYGVVDELEEVVGT